MATKQHDLIIIGGGPAGYVAALRAAQLGLDAACVDSNRRLGGTCLRIGCIPSKALLESSQRFAEVSNGLASHGIRADGVKLDLAAMMKRKQVMVRDLTKGIDGLFKKHKITRYQGHGRLEGVGNVVVEGENEKTQQLAARHILIATGSKPAELEGVELDGDRVGTSTEALGYDDVPEHLVVIGAGYIGLELGSVWSRLGAKVTVLEALDRILPGTDAELAAEAQQIFEEQGLQFRLGSRVKSAAFKRKKCAVECDDGETIRCDRVLLAVGRVANTDCLNLESAGVSCDEQGHIKVDDTFATSGEDIYAVGDCTGGPMLAHKASDEAVACVERIANGYGAVNYDAIPSVVYTHPEIASVGKTAEQLQQAGIEHRQGSFRFRANGRALTLGETEGRVNIVADARTDRVVGVHILGPRAGDLIAEAVAAIEFGATSEDIASCSHAHPTLCEALREAALAVERRALHT